MQAAGKDARNAVTGTGGGARPFQDITTGATDAAARTKEALEQAKALAAQQRAAAAEAAKSAAEEKKRAQEQKAAAEAAAKAQKEAANQSRELGPQLTDIFVGLTTGQSPLEVLLQQGGQLKDVFGGIGNAVKAVLSIFTVANVTIGAVAAAIGTVAYEAYQGAQESAALNKTLALTGNIAGTSAGQLSALSKQIAASQQAAVGDVSQTLTALVATGQYTSTTLGSAGKAAVALSKLTGESAVDTIKQFDGMSSGVAAWAQKSNQAYNFLSVAQFKYIQNLESQGRTQEAMKVALDALSSTMEQRAVTAVGSLEKAYNSLKSVLSGVLNYFRDIGKEVTPEARLEALRKKLADLNQERAAGKTTNDFRSPVERGDADADRARLQASIEAAESDIRENRRANTQIAEDKEKTQLDILHASKSFQDSLAAVDEAGAQKRLGEQLAALDRRQAAVELDNSKDLLSVRDYNEQLNAIDQQRLQAQAATVQREIQIAAGKAGTGTEQDRLASQAQVESLQGQLAQIKGQLVATATKSRQIAASDAFAEASETTAAWTQIWQQTFEQVRTLSQQNAATQAAQITQPLERARAEAAVKVADIERQVGDLQAKLTLRLNLTIDPAKAADLQREIDRLGTEAKTAIQETTRTATFQSLQQQFTDLNESLTLQEQRMQILVDQGALGVQEAEKRKFAARAQTLPQLEAIQRAMGALGSTTAEKNTIEQTNQDLLKLKDTTTEFQKSAKESGITALSTGLDEIATHSKSVKDGLLDIVSSFSKAMIELIEKRLATRLFDDFSSAASSFANSQGGGFLSTILGFFGLGHGSSAAPSADAATIATYEHTGGVIGGAGGWQQTVPSSVFAYAPRYHTGGIAGLRPNEVPAILEQGEEVITKDDPRHVRNAGSASVGDVSISVQVSGAEGTADDQRGAVDKMTAQIKAVVLDWATTQSRQGGILAKGR